MVLFYALLHFCPLFTCLEIGHNVTWPASPGVTQKAPRGRGAATGGIDRRVTYCPGLNVINAAPTNSLRESPFSLCQVRRVEKTSRSPQSQSPRNLIPTWIPFLLLSKKWCENLMKQDIKVLVLLQGRLITFRYAGQNVLFLLLQAPAQYRSSKAAG